MANDDPCTDVTHEEMAEKRMPLTESHSKSGNESLVPVSALQDLNAENDDTIITGKKPLKFWMCISAVMIASFLIMLEMSGVGTALPVIVSDLQGSQFVWVGSAYALTGTAFLPLSGGLAQVFGRRTVMLVQIFFFALGSALCGAAQSMNFLIAGRTVQGLGASGIASLSQIIIADLVPLHERGTYNGLIALAFGLGTAIAPVIGGSLAQAGQWRWFFFLNLPICAITAAMVAIFLDLKVPKGSFREKLLGLDWIGNAIIVAATTCIVLALTWGGVTFPWDSAEVLVPLVIGIVLLPLFILYEAKVPKTPLVPFKVMTTLTGISGYLQAFWGNFFLFGTAYYLPVYFQACKDASPTRSGVDSFGMVLTMMPIGIIAGVTVKMFKCYRPQIWTSWVLMMIGAGLFATLDTSTSVAKYVGYQLIVGPGIGILLITGFFPVLAPLLPSLNANALSFFMFVRWFAQIWGVTIGGTVLQNELQKKLPAAFLAKFPADESIAYTVIPTISRLSDPLKTQVQDAFAESLRTFWLVLVGVGGLGLLTSLAMKGIPLHSMVDKNWGLSDDKAGREVDMESNMARNF